MLWNQIIRMISEGSCETEDWSNDAENSVSLFAGCNVVNVKTMPSMGYREQCMAIEELFNVRCKIH